MNPMSLVNFFLHGCSENHKIKMLPHEPEIDQSVSPNVCTIITSNVRHFHNSTSNKTGHFPWFPFKMNQRESGVANGDGYDR